MYSAGMSPERLNRHARTRVPQFDFRIVSSRRELGSVRTKGDTTDHSIVISTFCNEPPCLGVPDGYIVERGSDQTSAVRTESNAVDIYAVLPEFGDSLTGPSVPDANQFVSTDRRKQLAVRAECDAQNGPLVPGERADFLASQGVPQLDGSVITRRRKSIAAWVSLICAFSAAAADSCSLI